VFQVEAQVGRACITWALRVWEAGRRLAAHSHTATTSHSPASHSLSQLPRTAVSHTVPHTPQPLTVAAHSSLMQQPHTAPHTAAHSLTQPHTWSGHSSAHFHLKCSNNQVA